MSRSLSPGKDNDNKVEDIQQNGDKNSGETQRNILKEEEFELSDEQKEACEDGFGMHGDGKGKIKANKLKTLHTMLDLEEPDDIANKILENKDIDAESDLDKEEYEKLVKHMVWLVEVEKCLTICFKAFDHDGDGFIDSEDLCRVMSEVKEPLNPDEVRGMMDQADGDCDGKVTYEEFKTAMLKQST